MPIPFRPIARLLARTVRPPPRVEFSQGQSFSSAFNQGTLYTVNHYTAPNFQVWWSAILISAHVQANIHWVVTSGWTNSGWLDGFTHWLFPLGSNILGFTPMPAMPPDPKQVELRASAVREVLGYAKKVTNPTVGIAPEGGDSPGGVLGVLPPGVGRFMYLLSKRCPQFVPVGIWKEDRIIQVRFGTPYQLNVPPGVSAHDLDAHVGECVMKHIAQLLPENLRGDYNERLS